MAKDPIVLDEGLPRPARDSTRHAPGAWRAAVAAIAAIAISSGAFADARAASGKARPSRPATPPAAVAAGMDEVGGHASGHVQVRLAPGVAPLRRADGRWTLRRGAGEGDPAIAALLDSLGVAAIVPSLSRPPADAALSSRLGLDRFVRMEVPLGSDTRAIAATLMRRGEWIEHAEIDGIGGVAGGGFPPDDPLFPMQWHLQNNGQSVNGVPGSVGSDIDPAAAWARTTGSPEIVVAVLDSGVNPHPELAGRILEGWNVPQGSTSTLDGCVSHGTHVSGILGARGGNAVGVAGLDWQVRLLPVVVVNPCSGLESMLADGLVFATDAGADIANMSLQYSVGSDLLRTAVRYASDSGVILVAASGNAGASSLSFPARWAETIAVGGSTNLDARWASSNYGTNLALLAPGEAIRSLVGFDQYGNKNGTSMAAPQVSGTISLMLAANPRLCVGRIRAILEETAEDLGTPGYDLFTGHGRLSAGAAVAAVPPPADLDGDCLVDGADLAAMLSAWGPCGGSASCEADLDGNGSVDGGDLAILLGAWGG